MLMFLMLGDRDRGNIARSSIRVRAARQEHYSAGIFDEYAWEMLLHLFVATSEREIMTESEIIRRSGATLQIGRRWLTHLLADGQISDRGDGEDISFTLASVARMRSFLDHAGGIITHAA